MITYKRYYDSPYTKIYRVNNDILHNFSNNDIYQDDGARWTIVDVIVGRGSSMVIVEFYGWNAIHIHKELLEMSNDRHTTFEEKV